MDLFKKKPTAAEQLRAADKELKKSTRDLEHERLALQNQEKQIKAEIKKMLQHNDEQGARVLAKALLQNRTQQTKLQQTKVQMSSVQAKNHTMASIQKQTQAMGTAAKVMAQANALNSPADVQTMMQQFAKQSQLMDMKEEMLNDGLDSLLDDEDMDVEVEAAMDQVLDEIGIHLNQKINATPAASSALPSEPQSSNSTADLSARLQRL